MKFISKIKHYRWKGFKIEAKQLSLVLLTIFALSFLYLYEHSKTVKLTLKLAEEERLLKKLMTQIERLRVREVSLASASRIYRLNKPE